MHLVNWDKCARPKKLGGLGIRKAQEHNVALLGKHAWALFQEDGNRLCIQILRSKYDNGKINFKAKGSRTWNSLCKAGKVLEKGFALKLGSGNASFFFDAWLSNEPICNQVLWVHIHDTALSFKDVLRKGKWHLNEVMTLLPNDLKLAVESFNVLLNDSVPNCTTWLGNIDGVYTTKSTYLWLMGLDLNVEPHKSWSWLWKLAIP
ncbi:hypothetical protein RIF29_17384 [Crotalaria pallida]|uniref:Uncharacterized protein n=1 Tax=Crotalaria pallida TaxID=3830 RepID=A0AAN9IEH1_CROPI